MSPDIPASFSMQAPQKTQQQNMKEQLMMMLKAVVGSATPVNNKVSESLDYEPIRSLVAQERVKSKTEGKKIPLWGYTGHTLMKFVVTTLTGIITGIIAVCLTGTVGKLTENKLAYFQSVLDGEGEARVFVAFLCSFVYSGCMVALATAMVQYWAPAAAGGGVTLVMAYLNGNHIPNLLRFSTLVTKFVGTVCAVSSGMPMGPEAPMVHMGACVASNVTYLRCKCVSECTFLACLGFRKAAQKGSERMRVMDEMVSDPDHREMVSAGASAGIAAAFGAPVGGVLFAMEEACTFWSRKTAWRCFICAVLSTFCIQLLNGSAQHGVINFVFPQTMDNYDWITQLPFILINASVAGLLGAIFNTLRMWLWKVRAVKTRHILRVLEVVSLALLVNFVGYFLSWAAGTCVEKPKEWGEYGMKFLCEEGEHNDLASLFLEGQHHTIVKLINMGHVPGNRNFHQPFTFGSLILFLVFYLVFMSIGSGLAIPAGLFMPSIIVGSTWGGFWGLALRSWLPDWNIQPGLYAVMAASGTLGGVFRSAISLVVLVIEGTRGIDYIFGIIISVIVANVTAQAIHHDGVYESELEKTGNVYMLHDEPSKALQRKTATDIMSKNTVIGFGELETVGRIYEVLRDTSHNGFPVFSIEPDSTNPRGRMEGIALRSQLLVLLKRRHFCDVDGIPIGRSGDSPELDYEIEREMRTFFRTYFTNGRYMSVSPAVLDSLQIDLDTHGTQYIDMRPWMNRSPFTVHEATPAVRCHQAFIALGLRHLVVTDVHNRVCGMITRKDLDHAAGHGWRPSHQVSSHVKTFQDFVNKVPSFGKLSRLLKKNRAHHVPEATSIFGNGQTQQVVNGHVDEDDERTGLTAAHKAEVGESAVFKR